jgi:hypothetical protein
MAIRELRLLFPWQTRREAGTQSQGSREETAQLPASNSQERKPTGGRQMESRRWIARSAGIAALLAPLAALASAAPAQAGLLSLSACDNSQLTQPFLRWADPNQYKLAPGGDFEGSLAGWTLTGGAQPTPGSDPYGITGSVGQSSLSLPGGSSATSPNTCVNAAYPDFRFMARTDTPGSTVLVQVVYQTLLGTTTIPVGVVAPSDTWQPTLPMVTGSAVTGLLSGGTAQVALKFTALSGSSQIDDVYVDPHGRG